MSLPVESMPDPKPSISATTRREEELRAAGFAMRMSLAVGVLMLVGKTTAYFMTGSAAILSDFAESVVHVIAVAFAAFSLRLSAKPAAPKFLYGYERITFFSAGFRRRDDRGRRDLDSGRGDRKMAGGIAAGTSWAQAP